MSSEAKFHAVSIAAMAVVLAVLATKWLVGPADVPATSISDQSHSHRSKPTDARVTHQPTILEAETTHASPVVERAASPPTPAGFSDYISDEDASTWCDASSAGFLPLPSPDGLKQY